MQVEKVADHIINWLRDYSNNSGTKGFVVGVSGGIDSALTSTLCANTGKPTLLLELPIHQAESQVSRAAAHIEWLMSKHDNVSRHLIELTQTYETFKSTFPPTDGASHDMSLVNLRARIRMSTLYYFSQKHGYLVAGTGNKVEDFGVGFYTKYGDGGVDLSPIADLMKSDVYAVSKHLGVGEAIMKAAPTDGLWGDNRSDEDQIGASYDELEWAMNYLDAGKDISALDGRQKEVMDIYTYMHKVNQHKMLPIPVCTIPAEFK